MGLLKQNPQSGYDLRKVFAATPMRHFSDSPGSIYPALRRLQGRKWLAVTAENGSARKRQVYRVTKAGERALVGWLSQEITREDVIWGLDALILRFAFLDGNVERSVTLKFLERLEAELSKYLYELQQYATTFGPGIKFSTGALAFQSGICGYEAQLAWVRQAQKAL
jgi:DNA-binding PadR family transcriptional regulator